MALHGFSMSKLRPKSLGKRGGRAWGLISST
eukprot:CAMPEP_0170294730 /NCGR_PEP_ID=MMETSP0116_2-20130129/47483_1 /TAXON_ID=400756 /ORGANISM="Durinskia baltica, Strain CSIRO CS-38" /LENGTH=30 /DNA_ID= /DNA_START= /DNA_END= /DNA_ORIENTATION=